MIFTHTSLLAQERFLSYFQHNRIKCRIKCATSVGEMLVGMGTKYFLTVLFAILLIQPRKKFCSIIDNVLSKFTHGVKTLLTLDQGKLIADKTINNSDLCKKEENA